MDGLAERVRDDFVVDRARVYARGFAIAWLVTAAAVVAFVAGALLQALYSVRPGAL